MEIKKKTMLWVVIGVLFVLALFMTFKAGASPSVATSTTQAASVAAKSAASTPYGGMVGGC